jgi:hypothetical protein
MVAPVFRQISHVNGSLTIVKICPFCRQDAQVTVPVDAYHLWDNGHGPLIQDCLPMLSPDEREILISGCHGHCFDNQFADEITGNEFELWLPARKG